MYIPVSSRPVTLNPPTNNSGQIGSTAQSDIDESDEEVGFYSDDDDFNDDDDRDNLWEPSSPGSEDITYESLV